MVAEDPILLLRGQGLPGRGIAVDQHDVLHDDLLGLPATAWSATDWSVRRLRSRHRLVRRTVRAAGRAGDSPRISPQAMVSGTHVDRTVRSGPGIAPGDMRLMNPWLGGMIGPRGVAPPHFRSPGAISGGSTRSLGLWLALAGPTVRRAPRAPGP